MSEVQHLELSQEEGMMEENQGMVPGQKTAECWFDGHRGTALHQRHSML